MYLENLSLAEFIVQSHKKAKILPVKRALGILANKLNENRSRHPAVHQFSFDEAVDEVLNRLRTIPIRDFVQHHRRITMPFDEFWIEQTAPVYDSKRRTRFGVLLRQEPNSQIITAKFAFETEVHPDIDVGSDLLVMDRWWRGKQYRYYVSATNVELIFGPKGIKLNTKGATLKKIFRLMASELGERDEAFKKYSDEELQKHFDNHRAWAEDIYRLLMLLSSHNVRSNLVGERTTRQDYFRGRLVGQRYRESKLPPMAVLTPIQIDLASQVRKLLKRRDAKSLKALLGWTDVMRHARHYYTLIGIIEKIIEPHDRRIAPPIDRRGARRDLTSSEHDLGIRLDVKRPRLVRRRSRRHSPQT